MERCEEITEDLPESLQAEVFSFSNYAKNRDQAKDPLAQPQEATSGESFEKNWNLIKDMDEEPTVLEDLPATPTPLAPSSAFARFLHFMVTPHYGPTLADKAKQHFREARRKIQRDKASHLANFPDTLDLKLLRVCHRAYLRLKSNLLEKY